jgi:hypothetical protein
LLWDMVMVQRNGTRLSAIAKQGFILQDSMVHV